jgi:vacuolar-type H+-ATPase subunit I/STV1
MLEPYAPTPIVAYLQGGLFIFLAAGYVYFGFVFKWPKQQKTGWELLSQRIPTNTGKVIKFITIVGLIPIFFGTVVWIVGRWAAYPTKYFAQEQVAIGLDCVSKNTWGKSSRGLVIIEGIRHDSGEYIKFPWLAEMAPDCPGTIVVIGRAWMLGVYVNEIRRS